MTTYVPGLADYVVSQVRCASVLQIVPGDKRIPGTTHVRVWTWLAAGAQHAHGYHTSDLTRFIQTRVQRRYEASLTCL